MTIVRIAILAFAIAATCAVRAEECAPPNDAPAVVVLELFTSQGCSSCPPAERFLGQLGNDQRLRGRIVPLAFHVDYWNHDGWSDPFSSAAWSRRQEDYSKRLSPDSIYTPQLVVDGRTQMNGSDEAAVVRELNTALNAAPPTRIALAVSGDATKRLAVDVCVSTPTAVDARELAAYVVVSESGLSTPVRRGENSGKTLAGEFVVRKLVRAFAFTPEPGAVRTGRVTVDVDRAWVATNLGVAVFVQDPSTLKIYGAAVR